MRRCKLVVEALTTTTFCFALASIEPTSYSLAVKRSPKDAAMELLSAMFLGAGGA
jgi:hypothetical protein